MYVTLNFKILLVFFIIELILSSPMVINLHNNMVFKNQIKTNDPLDFSDMIIINVVINALLSLLWFIGVFRYILFPVGCCYGIVYSIFILNPILST